jgi:peptidoglycan hydrolase-like protein with peptidoglycan-binding domain
MQYDPIEIRAQQLVLAFLGYYPGAIDGIWSASTISAMKKFECADEFLPAVPTGGMPFKVNARLPKGMFWDKRLVSHRGLTQEVAKELLEKRTRTTQQTPLQAKATVVTPNATPTAQKGIEKEADDFESEDDAQE